MAKKGKAPKAESAKSKPCRFIRVKDGKWEDGVMFVEGSRLLAITTKHETILCPPHKVKSA